MMGRGFTFIEILIILSVLLVITSIVLGSFSDFQKKVTLQKTAEKISSILVDVKSKTLTSRSDKKYGAHFESKTVTVFSGDTFVPGQAANQVFSLPSFISVSNISLFGDANNLIFNRLTGETNMSGFVIVSVDGEPSDYRRINISNHGVIEIQ